MTAKGTASDAGALSASPPDESAAWQKLLAFIANEGDGAEDAYQTARARLVKFFAWRGCRNVEDLADETLTRAANKLAHADVQAERPMAFIIGMARIIELEWRRREGRWVSFSESSAESEPAATPSPNKEQLLAALERCLEKMDAADRQLLLRYHEPRGERRALVRQVIAEELSMAVNALRVRMHRMRLRVEACVERHRALGGLAG